MNGEPRPNPVKRGRCVLSSSSLTATDAKHDSSDHVIVQTPVCCRRPSEWIDRRKRHRQLRLNYRARQLRELSRTHLGVVSADAELPARLRLRLDAVGVRDPAAIAQKIKASLELFTTGQREHGIDALRDQLSKTVGDVAAPRIDYGIGAEPPNSLGIARTPTTRSELFCGPGID